MTAVLKVEGLTVYREAYAAVKSVSFSLQEGTDTAIVGPNGAGKSTLVQALLGILPRKAGTIKILNQPLTAAGQLSSRVRQEIAYLPQHFLFDRLIPITVTELVALGWDDFRVQWFHWKTRERSHAVRQALSKVDAWHLRHQLIRDLSGGEMKRVLLAYCLVRPRSLLILDEAPAGLDIQSESAFYHLLYQLKQDQNWTILQISHDLNMVRRHCDHVLCLNQTLRCQGPPNDALTQENLISAYGSDFANYHHNCGF
ncbi:MAG: metal ABC transporter ATP-binding protein [Cyanobacteria bacterium P01_F01_bin.150]